MSVDCSERAGQFDGSVPTSARSVAVNHDSGSACIGILRITLLKYAGEIYPTESWYVASLVRIYPFLLIMPKKKKAETRRPRNWRCHHLPMRRTNLSRDRPQVLL